MSEFMKAFLGRPHNRKTAAEEALERRRQSETARQSTRQQTLSLEAAKFLDVMNTMESFYASAKIAAQRAEEAMRHATAPFRASERYLSSGEALTATTHLGTRTITHTHGGGALNRAMALGAGTPSSGLGGAGYYGPALTARPVPAVSGRGVTHVVFDYGKFRDLPVVGDIVADGTSGRLFEVVRLELARGFHVNVVGHELNGDMFTLSPIEERMPLVALRPATEEEIKIAKEAA